MNEVEGDIKWAVVIPAYNEELTIQSLVKAVLEQQPSQMFVVNDHSTDNTAAELKGLSVTLISNSQNLGKSGSLWQGFDRAIESDMEVVITIDGDGQHDPEDIPELLQKYRRNNNSIIIASRKRNIDTQPFSRFFANKFANFWVSWAAGYRISDSQSGYRVYPVSLLKSLDFLKKSEGFVFESEVLIEAARKNCFSTSIEIEALYPEERRASHFRPLQDILKITKMVATKLIEKRMNLTGLYAIIKNDIK